jgi:O-succinylbenzoic acid--CoA ligase
MVPLQVHESIFYGDDLSLIGQLIIGGGEIHPSVRDKLISMAAPALYESFAMTETYTHFALKRINGTQPDSIFRLLDKVRIRKDQRGCLVVEMEGITGGEIISNDLVEINQERNGFKWLGRYDNVINTGGVKIIPELLEGKIQELIGHHCLLLPETDVKLGNRLVLMVEYSGPERPEEKWTRLLQERLPQAEVPKKIVLVNQLPRNSAFKPDRIEARKRLSNL